MVATAPRRWIGDDHGCGGGEGPGPILLDEDDHDCDGMESMGLIRFTKIAAATMVPSEWSLWGRRRRCGRHSISYSP